MWFEIFECGTQFRWRLRTTDGRSVAESVESYPNKTDCLADIDLIQATDADTPVRIVRWAEASGPSRSELHQAPRVGSHLHGGSM